MDDSTKEQPFALEATSPNVLSSEQPSRTPIASPPSGVAALSEEILRVLSSAPLTAGTVVANRYRLVEVLGDGGMGQVFIAENLSIGRRVAIKVLKPELLADASFRRRFQQEAEAIAAIEHKNVARFFDLVVGDPTFLVMEFVPGPTLSAVLRKGRLEPERAIRIGRQLCWALAAAHEAGVIHRDIKPANIVLAPDPENGEEAKLIDFGLAKLGHVHTGEGLTRAGQIIGTPNYMPPEQIANREVDARSDVYALGCVLYQMLTGAPPFAASDDVKTLYQQLHSAPRPPSDRVPGLSAELDAVIARCLAKEAGARYGSMREMAEALGRLDLDLAETRERVVSPSRRAALPRAATTTPTPQQPPPPSASVGLVVVAFALGAMAAGGGVWFGSRAPGGARLMVSSQPAAATVDIDGTRWNETTPTVVTGLGAGAHRVIVRAEGHDAVEQTVNVQHEGRATVDVALPPQQRTVEMQSIPAGALVFVDGNLVQGRTPLRVSLAQDDFHELRFELDGFETETRALEPEDREPRLTVHLEAAKTDRGTLWVEGPTAAEVYLDGTPTGNVAPTLGIQVPVGAHTVELRGSDGTVVALQTVAVKRGETLHLVPAALKR